jgi:acyl transferase domain-containing protein/acyl carrier protein
MRRNERRRAREDIAIIGMSGRFPGARNIAEFWDNLRNGVESITSFSRSELEASGVPQSAFDNPDFVPAGSVIEDSDLFDADFFGFSPREAESLDPQQRLFLETAWHALEDAGYVPESFPGLIGVYGGCAMSTYLNHLQSNPRFMALLGYLQVYIGNDKDYLTTHVSYKLNLKGPSFSVQTACSTSLLAVAVAADHLLSHQCDMALAGGVCVRVPQATGYYFEPGGIFSPDGHCRVFDERAAGVVFGNGVGIVVLKRLSDAMADGDAIDAVLRGWAVNNDGAAKASYAAPSLEGQADVIARAQGRAGVSPDTITYIEAHGTGTSVGDPIEIAALTKAFRANTKRNNFCAVGSVKTNVGHLDPAAGVASLVKTILALQHKQIPPSLNCESLNPEIDFADSPFFVNRRLSEWTVGRAPRRAGVSGFGIGGTNVHLVLEEAPTCARADGSRPDQLLVVSASGSAALETAVSNLADHLEQATPEAADVAYTCQVGRRALNHRCALVYRDLDDLVAALKAKDPRRLLVASETSRERSVAFMFSGQGSQYVNMALGLYQSEATFRTSLDGCAETLAPRLALDLRDLLFPAPAGADQASAQLAQTWITQPVLFAVEYSLAQLWMEWGIRPDAMIGHSIGEYVAACLAGVFSLDDALALVAERGRLMQELPRGSMLAVPLHESELQPFLDTELDLAATNEPALCVASGPAPSIERLQERLSQHGCTSRRLHTSHAFHSKMMDPILEAFTARVREVPLHSPQVPYISNVTGDWISAAEATNPRYWARHLRQPVRFVQGLRRLLEEQDRVLLEVGPGQSLSTFARRHPDKQAGQLVVSSLRHPQDRRADPAFILDSLARLWLAGARIDWSGLHAHERLHRVHLPVYPFERQRYWAELADSTESAALLIWKEPDIGDWFYVPSWDYAVPPESDAVPAASRCLVFEDDCGIARSVVDRLEREGHEVVVVARAEHYAQTGSGTYEIQPERRDHYLMLLRDLHEAGRLPQRVLHMWNVGPADEERSEIHLFDDHQDLGFYSLLYLAQALIKLRIGEPIDIVAASSGVYSVTGEEQIIPARAPLAAACRAIPQEYPNIMCRNVDVEAPVGGGSNSEGAAAQLIAELLEDKGHPTVAYRKGQRWVQTFEPLPLEESEDTIFPLRPSGVYLITGGLGGIGLALAEFLASAAQAKLVLVGRSPFPAKDEWNAWLESHDAEDETSTKIQRLRDIEDLGAEVLITNADVADEAQMQLVLEQTHSRFGALHGVIHAAGNVSPGGFFGVDEADHELCERQFRAKVRGLAVLAEKLQSESLDFVVLFSSISSVLAGLGYIAYAAANSFMDAFAHKYSQASGILWTSVDWDTWQLRETRGSDVDPAELSMDPDEGVEAFRRILSSALLPQIVVSTGYLHDRIDQWVNVQSLREAKQRRERQSARLHARPDLATSYLAPRTSIERELADIWQEMLGVAQVGVIDNFFSDLGGSSILATQLIAQLRERFHAELPLRRFFEGPTIAEMAEVIDAQPEKDVRLAPTEDVLVRSDT